MTEVFIDSGAFIAYLVRSDRLHVETARLFERPPPRWCTSVLVVAESYGWFLHKLGEETARTFRAFIGSCGARTTTSGWKAGGWCRARPSSE